jgi:serine/threonine protein kinase
MIKTIREPPPNAHSYVGAAGSAPIPISDAFQKFISQCLQRDPRLRSSARDLLQDPFLKKASHVSDFADFVSSTSLRRTVTDTVSDTSTAPSTCAGAEHAPNVSEIVSEFARGTTWVFPVVSTKHGLLTRQAEKTDETDDDISSEAVSCFAFVCCVCCVCLIFYSCDFGRCVLLCVLLCSLRHF